ncbi:MAG: hypothetical protein KDD76_06690, partial [Rickettsiales bacterium]|nr:hypothetical protein [Rickettsiales bacterium]
MNKQAQLKSTTTMPEPKRHTHEQGMFGKLMAAMAAALEALVSRSRHGSSEGILRRKTGEGSGGSQESARRMRGRKQQSEVKEMAARTQQTILQKDQRVAEELVVLDIIHDKERFLKTQEQQDKTLSRPVSAAAKEVEKGLFPKLRRRFNNALTKLTLLATGEGSAGSLQRKEDATGGTQSSSHGREMPGHDESQLKEMQARTELKIQQGVRETVESVILADIISDKLRLLDAMKAELQSGRKSQLLESLKQ